MMKNKHEIINKIIADTEAKSFLELGYGSGHNFNKIKCDVKVGVDPSLNVDKGAAGLLVEGSFIVKKSSDDFFEDNDDDFDVIFIDGLHHCDQVRKDISNALKCSPKAVILHDTIPHSKEMQEVPRNTKQWTGDCWRAAVGFIESYPDVRVETYRSDFGVSVFYPEGKKTRKYFEDTEMSYEYFKKNAVELLRIID